MVELGCVLKFNLCAHDLLGVVVPPAATALTVSHRARHKSLELGEATSVDLADATTPVAEVVPDCSRRQINPGATDLLLSLVQQTDAGTLSLWEGSEERALVRETCVNSRGGEPRSSPAAAAVRIMATPNELPRLTRGYV